MGIYYGDNSNNHLWEPYPKTESDKMFGFGGNDFIEGGYGNDSLYGGSGNDQVNGDEGNDILYGESGIDTLLGGEGNDWLYGQSEIDRLEGGNGNDVLDGGTGADWMFGGLGDDYYYVDNVGDYIWETDGWDAVASEVYSYTLPTGVERLNLGENGVIGYGNTLNNLIFDYGNVGVSYLYGGYGNDTLWGYTGDDFLAGEWGNDTIYGGDNIDTIAGGANSDTLWGEGGADYFTYYDRSESINNSYGWDIIKDFNRWEGDKIDLSWLDANLNKSGSQAFTVDHFNYYGWGNNGYLEVYTIGGSTMLIELAGAPQLNIATDIIM
ncbi:MAG TPA: hypothetical protein PK068_09765 [Nitrosomonas sp.]|nr:hypothetical protein [Nitrosomonas sp.]